MLPTSPTERRRDRDTMGRAGFAPGFRLSSVDVIVLAAGTVAAIALATVTWWWGFVVAFVLAHFFLFCNIVRMARPLELAWAAVFVVPAGATVALDTPGWLVTAAVSLTATVIVVVAELRKPSYHGVGWRGSIRGCRRGGKRGRC